MSALGGELDSSTAQPDAGQLLLELLGVVHSLEREVLAIGAGLEAALEVAPFLARRQIGRVMQDARGHYDATH